MHEAPTAPLWWHLQCKLHVVALRTSLNDADAMAMLGHVDNVEQGFLILLVAHHT